MQNSTYNPANVNLFEKSKLNKDAIGISGTMVAGDTATLDITLTDDILLCGGNVLLAKNIAWGDSVDFQILSGSVVLVQFVTNWYLDPSTIAQIVPVSNYPAKVPAGLILRIVYHSVGDVNPEIAINYNREKILI